MSNLFFYAPFLLVPCAVQLVILFATQRRFRPLRFAVPILVGLASIAVIIFTALYCSPTLENGLGILLDILLVLMGITILRVLRALASLVLTGWGLAWFVYYLVNLKKRKVSDTP